MTLRVLATLALTLCAAAQSDVFVYPDMPSGSPPRVANPDAEAASEAEMKRYVETIPGSDVKFAMLPIPGGKFRMGSPEGEAQRKADECTPTEVEIAPFWMEEHETTWDEYRLFQFKLDIELRKAGTFEKQPSDAWADAVSRPTPPYVPMDFGMGVEGFPAISMTEFAARHYTKWLSMKTGRFYRLPTEAEWEYAARNGADGNLYPWGDNYREDAAVIGKQADVKAVGSAKSGANKWGVEDLIGNVWELTSSLGAAYPGSEIAIEERVIVLRGGGYFDSFTGENAITATFRALVPPETKDKSVGFRLVK